jgi:hypothetical protein
MSLLLLFHPQKAAAGGGIQSGDISFTASATATFSGASVSESAATVLAESVATFSTAAVSAAEMSSLAESAVMLAAASIASAPIASDGEAGVILESDAPVETTIESGDFAFGGESTVDLAGASLAEATAEAVGASTAVMVGATAETATVYRPAWWRGIRKRKRKPMVELDDEEVLALARMAIAEAEAREVIRLAA